ncbi:MAG TPA: DUF4974 domain-containing protein [Gemmatimonadaceae bacterium]
MADDLDWRLLDRHLAGEASHDDAIAIRHWLAADPAREGELRALTSVVRSPDDAEWNTARAWSRISARLHEPRLTLHLERRSTAPSRGRVWLAASAAAFVAGALVVIVWWPAHSSRPSADAPTVTQTATAPAQQSRDTLRGGTAIDGTLDSLVLDDVMLGQAASEIGRRFGVRVDIANQALAARRVSARFRDEPLPRVLDSVSAVIGARWTRDGDRVLLEETH